MPRSFGNIPTQPYSQESRVVATRVNSEFVRKLRQLAVDKDCTVADIAKQALFEYVGRNSVRPTCAS